MSSLQTNEKQVLEHLFQMATGYVLNFKDRSFGEFFRDDVGVDIFSEKYNYASGSKANRIRAFWQCADDKVVASSILKLLGYLETQILLGNLRKEDFSDELIKRARAIASRLVGAGTSPEMTTDEFVSMKFGEISIAKLGLDGGLTEVITQRISEIKRCLHAGSPLAVIFLCGSSLEGILLGIACRDPRGFNQSKVSPKENSGKVRQFQDWTLNDFINVARDLNLVGEDVKKFSHALRDFRNYIHPFQQMASDFKPSVDTARICWQVLQAAIAQLSNNTRSESSR